MVTTEEAPKEAPEFTYSLTVICKDKKKTAMLQAADMFEPFKVILEYNTTVGFKTQTCRQDYLEWYIPRLKQLLESDGEAPIAIFSPGSPVGAWRDKTVKSISTGQKWCLFSDYLTAHGYLEGDVTNPKRATLE